MLPRRQQNPAVQQHGQASATPWSKQTGQTQNQKKCYMCGREGHLVFACPSLKTEDSASSSDQPSGRKLVKRPLDTVDECGMDYLAPGNMDREEWFGDFVGNKQDEHDNLAQMRSRISSGNVVQFLSSNLAMAERSGQRMMGEIRRLERQAEQRNGKIKRQKSELSSFQRSLTAMQRVCD